MGSLLFFLRGCAIEFLGGAIEFLGLVTHSPPVAFRLMGFDPHSGALPMHRAKRNGVSHCLLFHPTPTSKLIGLLTPTALVEYPSIQVLL